jgi:nucleoside-diphosphate-sugar epimerase
MKGFKRTFKKILTFMMLILLNPQVTEILSVIDHVSSKINNFNSKTKEVQNDFETHKKIVCLTGSSGNMWFVGFKTLYAKKDRYSLVLLNLDNQPNRKKFAKYIHDSSVKLIWVDLTNYEDALKCANGSHYVLHVGGMVSPAADYYPNTTIHTNVMAAKNIIKAIKSQSDPLSIKVVYVGSVAQTGDRNEPLHWSRTGDPIKISIYDHYAISKTIAKRIFIESGLQYWISLRQSGILYPNLFKNIDPIIFYIPLNRIFE